MVYKRALAIGLVLPIALAACGKGSDEEADATSKESVATLPGLEDAETAFRTIEERLLAANTVRVVSKIQAHGAVNATLDGTLLLQQANLVNMDFAGVFASNPVYLLLTSDGSWMRGGPKQEMFGLATPDALGQGILIGATRMGLLHNLVLLSSGSPPERTDGTVQEWVRVSNFQLGKRMVIAGADAQAVDFDIFVDGQHSAHGSLWISLETGLPVQRDQTVFFSEGDMRVVEQYDAFEIDGVINPDNFQL